MSRTVALTHFFSCFSYFPEPEESHSLEQIAMAMRDCEVFMALVSDAYVNDKYCCDTFRYARQTLRKTLLMVVLGEGLEWRKSKLGLLVSDEVGFHDDSKRTELGYHHRGK